MRENGGIFLSAAIFLVSLHALHADGCAMSHFPLLNMHILLPNNASGLDLRAPPFVASTSSPSVGEQHPQLSDGKPS